MNTNTVKLDQRLKLTLRQPQWLNPIIKGDNNHLTERMSIHPEMKIPNESQKF